MAHQPDYRGRFAPSPTGPLHMGSLLAALASYLDARAAGGVWLLRIEDIDPPREAPGAADSILRTLEAHGLLWDETVLYQSTRLDAYAEALNALQEAGRTFACCCTRSTLGPGGSCMGRCQPCAHNDNSVRIKLCGNIGFDDQILGPQSPSNAQSDLVLRRKDGLYAYALAVVVDDAWQRISHVVRGSDLLSQTFAQLEIFTALGAPLPAYGHLPVVSDAQGIKLSKQTGARAIVDACALDNLRVALRLLQQDSAGMPAGSAPELLCLAAERWSPGTLIEHGGKSLVYP
ncbi:tRNA glutamyl-Q(34) synthetase GluQRS [Congregibacter variabilis]|uniref:tRNA glutamyl-Q(34) synthetase GluQRS n=1 Tax=Congregibacter variabilis TaxID=3081200 RepID=A0ABZ0HY55_9GAMM|nr:tRNA glutamyl-Q(34) synthetase GluQRS [Congregibacter sp. IMCC43200]